MKKTINVTDFIDEFRACGRYDQFGYGALNALFEYLENYADGTGEEIELDVIAICGDYTQYDSAIEAAEELISGFEREEGEEEEEYEERAIGELLYHTTVIEYDSGVVVGSF